MGSDRTPVSAPAATVLLLVAAVLDSAWVAEFWLPNGLSRVSAYLSQWESPGVPYAPLWRGCFTASDLAVAAAVSVVLAGRVLPGRGRAGAARRGAYWIVGWSALAVYAVASAAGDLIPMRDDLWPFGTPWSRLLLSESLHGSASVLSGTALIVALAALTRSASAGGTGRGAATPLARYGRYALALQLVSSLALVAAILADFLAGVAGRLELSTEACCLVLLATSLIPAGSSPGSFRGSRRAATAHVSPRHCP